MKESNAAARFPRERCSDPKAMQIAQSLQKATQADIAILFGSRARGDYDEGRSDIDVIIVDDHLVDSQKRGDALHEAKALAESIYHQPTAVQILWFDHETFGRMRRTVNHIVARAIQEGVIMPRNPEDYSSRYSEEYDAEEYEWTVTDQRIRNAETHLVGFIANYENVDDPYHRDRLTGKNAQEGIEHALKAVISAAGVRYPREHSISLLTDLANDADPELHFQPSIEPRILNQYAGSDDYYEPAEPISDIPDYYQAVTNDITALIERARELRET